MDGWHACWCGRATVWMRERPGRAVSDKFQDVYIPQFFHLLYYIVYALDSCWFVLM